MTRAGVRIRRGLARAATAGAAMVVLAWAVGLGTGDRWSWSQWLAWIPASAVVVASAIAALFALVGGSRRAAVAWTGLAAAGAVLVLTVEHRPFASAPTDAGHHLRVVHWTVAEGMSGETKTHVLDVATGLDPDLVVFTNAGWFPQTPALAAWIDDGPPPLLAGPFRILTRRSVIALRVVVASDGVRAARLVVAVPEAPGGRAELLLVDLPSDPRRGRMQVARRARRLLESVGVDPAAIDVAVGDFNLTRDSVALRHLLPGHRHAWSDAGRGCGASFPRVAPIVHIDHVLLAPGVRCTDYRLLDGGEGRHRLQVADLAFGG